MCLQMHIPSKTRPNRINRALLIFLVMLVPNNRYYPNIQSQQNYHRTLHAIPNGIARPHNDICKSCLVPVSCYLFSVVVVVIS